MQELEVTLSVTIPSDYVLISKVELKKLKQNELVGVYWNMRDLEARTGKKHDWIKENILHPLRFRKVLDVDHGGFVYYPKVKGQTWTFLASRMAEFLDKNFQAIFKERG